ncbi:MAG: hypothetical protein R3C56_05180 [Pirellulaceae bacterium]
MSTESLLVDLAFASASTATDSGVTTADGREVLRDRGYGRGANLLAAMRMAIALCL